MRAQIDGLVTPRLRHTTLVLDRTFAQGKETAGRARAVFAAAQRAERAHAEHSEQVTAMEVATLMTPNPAVVVESDPLSRAAELMRNGNFGLVPVVDDLGYPVGVVTPRDVCTKTLELARAPQDIRVRDAMRRDVATIPVEATLREAQERMACAGVRRLVVVDATGALVGVLSLSDIASAFAYAGHGLNGSRQVEHTLARMRRARELTRNGALTHDRRDAQSLRSAEPTRRPFESDATARSRAS